MPRPTPPGATSPPPPRAAAPCNASAACRAHPRRFAATPHEPVQRPFRPRSTSAAVGRLAPIGRDTFSSLQAPLAPLQEQSLRSGFSMTLPRRTQHVEPPRPATILLSLHAPSRPPPPQL